MYYLSLFISYEYVLWIRLHLHVIGGHFMKKSWVKPTKDIVKLCGWTDRDMKWYTLWQTNILPWKITFFNGKIHYFYGHFQ